MDRIVLKPRLCYRIEPSLRDLVSRILPLASIYLSLEAFVELHSRFEYGFVSHALCAAIRTLLKVLHRKLLSRTVKRVPVPRLSTLNLT